jgi:hypothetical protein
MKNKSILFALAVCVGMQFGVSFGVEEGSGPAQPTQSLSDWFSSGAGRAWSAAKSASGRAVQAVRSAPSAIWEKSKRDTDVMTPLRSATMIGGASALKVMAEISNSNFNQARSLAFASGWLYSPEEALKKIGEIDPKYAAKMGLAVGAGAFIYTYVITKISAYYRAKDITREQAVSQVRDAISFVLSDSMAYPTRSSKIHALLKKNEFIGSGMEDVDGIVAQACAELSKQIAAVKVSPEQMQADKLVDAEMSKIRRSLVSEGTLEEQIATAKTGITDLLRALESPAVKAQIATVLRLEKQQLVEQAESGTFGKTSSSKFYEPMSEKESADFESRKTNWESNMDYIKRVNAEREKN